MVGVVEPWVQALSVIVVSLESGVLDGVASRSHDRGSKRAPLPIALVLLQSETLIKNLIKGNRMTTKDACVCKINPRVPAVLGTKLGKCSDLTIKLRFQSFRIDYPVQVVVGMTTILWDRVQLPIEFKVLVAALWDKKLAFRTRERRKILDFYGRTATQGEKEIFGSRAASKFSFGERERPAHNRSNLFIVFTASVRSKAIFGSRAASKFSFGERERPAQRSN
ncbi:hypothetical protein TNCV_307771 [Trichonephila clavipes]|nr:hypothetical protein TNCV_307771 [Trichonephila clavipes]